MKRFLILFLVLFLLSGCNEKEVVKDVQEDTLNYAFVIGKNDDFLLIQDNKGIIYEKAFFLRRIMRTAKNHTVKKRQSAKQDCELQYQGS